MSEQATPQRDSDDDTQLDGAPEQSDQNGEEQQPGAVPSHSEDRPTDPSPGDEG
jgi:hypothetical protein